MSIQTKQCGLGNLPGARAEILVSACSLGMPYAWPARKREGAVAILTPCKTAAAVAKLKAGFLQKVVPALLLKADIGGAQINVR